MKNLEDFIEYAEENFIGNTTQSVFRETLKVIDEYPCELHSKIIIYLLSKCRFS